MQIVQHNKYYTTGANFNTGKQIDESGNLALLQTTDYYPFGLTMANGNKANANQPYQYGGKEWQNNTQVYDFHARQYNPALGRWFNIDPMLEKFSGTSTYNYCLNNPINVIDPDGMNSVLPEKPWNWNENVHGTWGTMSSLRQAGYDPWTAMNMAMEYKMSLARKNGASGGSQVYSSTADVFRDIFSRGFTWKNAVAVHYSGYSAELFGKFLEKDNTIAIKYNEGENMLVVVTKSVYNTQIDPHDPNKIYASDGPKSTAVTLGFSIVSVNEDINGKGHKIKEWSTMDYLGATSLSTGAYGIRIGNYMYNLRKFRPITSLGGRIIFPATSGYRLGFIPGSIATKLGYGLKLGGNLLGGFGLAYSGIKFMNDPSVKGAFDTVMGGIGFLGPIGLGVSAVYFIGDVIIPGGWEAVPQHQMNEIKVNTGDGIFFRGVHNHFK